MPADITRAEILEHAIEIAKDYATQHMTLTLRQMYYQFVSRGLTESGQNVYKRIGDTLTDARYNGSFPIDWLEDRGRDVGHTRATRTVSGIDDALKDVAGITKALPDFLINRARWHGQDTCVSVWVEKQALEGVFEGPCADMATEDIVALRDLCLRLAGRAS